MHQVQNKIYLRNKQANKTNTIQNKRKQNQERGKRFKNIFKSTIRWIPKKVNSKEPKKVFLYFFKEYSLQSKYL